jgi:hypothetical protein
MDSNETENGNARREGVIRLGEGDLRNFLDLPEGYRIKAVVPTHNPPGITLLVESPTLPSVPYDAEAPLLNGHPGHVRRYDAATDKMWIRWNWVLG